MRIPLTLLTFMVLVSGCSEKRFRQNKASAMSPTIQPNESFVADMSAFRTKGPERWDVVVFHPPPAALTPPAEVWVMRVVGLPGESLEIREDGIYIDGKREAQPERLAALRYAAVFSAPAPSTISYPYKIAAESYFLLGDNVTNSLDSRFWGALSRQNILGRVKNK